MLVKWNVFDMDTKPCEEFWCLNIYLEEFGCLEDVLENFGISKNGTVMAPCAIAHVRRDSIALKV